MRAFYRYAFAFICHVSPDEMSLRCHAVLLLMLLLIFAAIFAA